MSDSQVRLFAVGDVHPNRPKPETLLRRVAPLLSSGDIVFGQLECTISDKGEVRSDVRNPAHRVDPHNVDALIAGGFDFVTYAGNNNLDYGRDAFLDTIERLGSHGIQVVGAGRDLDEATRPLVVERGGIRFAFVSHCSILPRGYAATASRPGISPLEISTFYEPIENIYEQPGTPAKTITIARQDDIARIQGVIRGAKSQADIVIACFHWGVHFTFDLAMYQPEVAYAAIDAGADIVIGTHPHCLQAVDVYKGKPIFYSMGNFAFEQPGELALRGASSYLAMYGIPADETVPGHPHPSHCRPSMILDCTFSKQGLVDFQLIPSYLSDECEPEILESGERYKTVVDLVRRLSTGIGTVTEVKDRTIRVDLSASKPDTREILRRQRISYPSLKYLSTEDV